MLNSIVKGIFAGLFTRVITKGAEAVADRVSSGNNFQNRKDYVQYMIERFNTFKPETIFKQSDILAEFTFPNMESIFTDFFPFVNYRQLHVYIFLLYLNEKNKKARKYLIDTLFDFINRSSFESYIFNADNLRNQAFKDAYIKDARRALDSYIANGESQLNKHMLFKGKQLESSVSKVYDNEIDQKTLENSIEKLISMWVLYTFKFNIIGAVLNEKLGDYFPSSYFNDPKELNKVFDSDTHEAVKERALNLGWDIYTVNNLLNQLETFSNLNNFEPSEYYRAWITLLVMSNEKSDFSAIKQNVENYFVACTETDKYWAETVKIKLILENFNKFPYGSFKSFDFGY